MKNQQSSVNWKYVLIVLGAAIISATTMLAYLEWLKLEDEVSGVTRATGRPFDRSLRNLERARVLELKSG